MADAGNLDISHVGRGLSHPLGDVGAQQVRGRAADQKRRLLLSIEGRKAQLDALERPAIELIEKSADDISAELERNLAASGDQDAVEAKPEEFKEAAE